MFRFQEGHKTSIWTARCESSECNFICRFAFFVSSLFKDRLFRNSNNNKKKEGGKSFRSLKSASSTFQLVLRCLQETRLVCIRSMIFILVFVFAFCWMFSCLYHHKLLTDFHIVFKFYANKEHSVFPSLKRCAFSQPLGLHFFSPTGKEKAKWHHLCLSVTFTLFRARKQKSASHSLTVCVCWLHCVRFVESASFCFPRLKKSFAKTKNLWRVRQFM